MVRPDSSFPKGTPRRWREEWLAILDNPHLARTMGLKGRVRCRELFNARQDFQRRLCKILTDYGVFSTRRTDVIHAFFSPKRRLIYFRLAGRETASPPLEIDVGCHKGRFLVEMARRSSANFLRRRAAARARPQGQEKIARRGPEQRRSIPWPSRRSAELFAGRVR